jgi:formate dehydrogenase assembly factor FdhD
LEAFDLLSSQHPPAVPLTAVHLGAPARDLHPVNDAPRLSSIGADVLQQIEVTDEHGDQHRVHIPIERDLTVVVDGRVIGKLWTLGSQPEWLVLGYLRNRRLIEDVTQIESVSIEWAATCGSVWKTSAAATVLTSSAVGWHCTVSAVTTSCC